MHTPRFEAAKKRNSSSTKTKKKQRYAKREQFSAGQGERELRMQTELEHSSVVYRRDARGKGEGRADTSRLVRGCVSVLGEPRWVPIRAGLFGDVAAWGATGLRGKISRSRYFLLASEAATRGP